MKLKKMNAVLSLLTLLTMILHVGYCIFAYLTMYYNPFLKLMTAVPFLVLACLHAVCGMAVVFFLPDGTRLDLYPRQNMQTILQRGSAALIFPLLILHLRTFDLLSASAKSGNRPALILLLLSEPLFYGTVITHVAVSVSKALITLGVLTSAEGRRKLDRILYVLGAVFFAAAVFSVLRGQLMMFGGAMR